MELVAANRAADAESHLVPRELTLLDPVGLVVERVGRQLVAAIEVIAGAAEIVRARLRQHVHNAAGRAPVLRREVAGDHAELLDGVERDLLTDRGIELVVVRRPVQQDVGARGALTVDVVAGAARRLSPLLAVGHAPARHVAGDGYQVVDVAGDGRQLANLRFGDRRRDLAVRRVDAWHFRDDVDVLLGAGQVHPEVYVGCASDGDRHLGVRRSEAVELGRDVVLGWRQVGENVDTQGVGDHRARGASADGFCLHGDAGQNASGRIGDDARDPTCLGLSHGWVRERKKHR